MKTSNKIILGYFAVFVAFQVIFLINTVIQYQDLKPIGKELCQKLSNNPIHHMEVYISGSAYTEDTRRWEERQHAPWIIKTDGHRSFYVGANLKTSRIGSDTLYITALNDDISGRPNCIPELRTARIITAEEVLDIDF